MPSCPQPPSPQTNNSAGVLPWVWCETGSSVGTAARWRFWAGAGSVVGALRFCGVIWALGLGAGLDAMVFLGGAALLFDAVFLVTRFFVSSTWRERESG